MPKLTDDIKCFIVQELAMFSTPSEVAQAFLEEISTNAIANRAYRLRMFDRMLHLAVGSGNLPLAAQLMKQAAKECGDSFSNRHVLTGKDGKPLIPAPPPLTDEQVDSRLAMLLGKMVDAPAPKT